MTTVFTPMADPYRTLGIPRGASLADVKRAYRRLAKQYHPDSAGSAALRRFLAVQDAYEAIVRSAPSANRAATSPRTDADRFGTAREAARERARSAHARGGGAGAPGREGSGGPDRGHCRPTAGESPGSDPRPTRRRATMTSTSYDDAMDGEPAWSGSSWYGAASGTYWTLNPREFADPRKHGPEYAARARRAAHGPGTPATGDVSTTPTGAGADAPPRRAQSPIARLIRAVHGRSPGPGSRVR